MSKVYKGYELMEKAMKGEININQKVNSLSEDYKDCTLKFVLNDTAIHVMGLNFELIEENTIDIDSIGEYPEYFIENSTSTEDVKSLARKYNELVQAIKQVNKEMQELKQGTDIDKIEIDINEAIKKFREQMKVEGME